MATKGKKKTAVKKAVAKKVVKKTTSNKAVKKVAKKPVAAAKKKIVKKAVLKKPVKKVAVKKAAVKKAVAKKTVVKKAVAKKAVVKKAVKKIVVKKAVKKIVKKQVPKKVVKKIVVKKIEAKINEVKKPVANIESKEPQSPAKKRVRYSDADLQMFKELINQKLAKAKDDYEMLRSAITHSTSNDVEDTSPTFKVLEEGASSLSKEESGELAQRLYKYIQSLEAALVRIENKTYGIDRISGELIPKARLMLVPHATLSVESKNKQ